jgi:hypothetical protein
MELRGGADAVGSLLQGGAMSLEMRAPASMNLLLAVRCAIASRRRIVWHCLRE